MTRLVRRLAGTYPFWCAIENDRVVDGSALFLGLNAGVERAAQMWPHHPDLSMQVREVSLSGEPVRIGRAVLGMELTELDGVVLLPGEDGRVYLAGTPLESPSDRHRREALTRWRSDLADVVTAPLPQMRRIHACLELLLRYVAARHVMIVEARGDQFEVINGASERGPFGLCCQDLAERFAQIRPRIDLARFVNRLEDENASSGTTLTLVHPIGCALPETGRWLVADAIGVENEDLAPLIVTTVSNWIGNILHAADEVQLSRERDRLYAEVVRAMSDAVLVVDAHQCVVQGNDAAARLTGVAVGQMTGMPVSDLLMLTGAGGEPLRWPALCQGEQPHRIEPTTCELPRRESLTMVKGSCVRLARSDRGGDGDTFVLVLHDVSHEIEHMRRAEWEATHDALTCLHNRAGFERALARCSGGGQMICVDLDRFKIINDTCGHAAGDEVLRAVADLMRAKVRRDDILARIGGDEFFIALPNCPEDGAVRIAESIRQAVADYCYEDDSGERFHISASIGVSAYLAGDALQKVRADADAAMYSAKHSGKNRIVVFDDSPHAMGHSADAQWAHRIERAIEEHRIELWRQPIVDLQANRSRGYEVLARLRDEGGGLVGAGEFIPPAERYDLIGRLDRYIIEQVAYNFDDVIRGGRYASVNLSGRSVSDPGLVEWVIDCFDRAGVTPHQVCIELTETAAVADHDVALALMEKLRRAGFLIALDDLGSGVASFANLRRLPVDIVKLDGGYVRGVVHDEGAQNILRAVVQVARTYGIDTVAEWIEDAQTAAWVSGVGITRGQGYYLGAPEAVMMLGRARMAKRGRWLSGHGVAELDERVPIAQYDVQ